MRTTVTLDPDVESLLRRLMQRRGISFKQALNDAVRVGAADGPREEFQTTTRGLGVPTVNLDRALQIAADLEDDELVRRMRSGK
ncbi:antitoxin [Epidermidibacterium keratini]|uniref:Antitoxin n=1 Tax=Epidermidibacterium keratini TaxID=1891644 RepID=A0A7L4YSF4_9ACTN|nr:antitoxin [Epidermidibacterium keratini]QHC01719.1 antitoxin [Epidermidibacterium keratini]